VRLNTHLNLLPKLRKGGAIPRASTDTNVDLLSCLYFGVNYRCHFRELPSESLLTSYITVRQTKQSEE
jgi:hypothetical protein